MKRLTKCTICGRTDVNAIDDALRAERPLRALAAQFRTSTSTLDRHKQHVRHPSSKAPAPPPAHGLAAPMRTEELISNLEAIVQQQVLRLANDNDLSEGERAKLQTAAVTTLAHLAKLQGRTEVNERKILASPQWRRIEETIIEVLEKFPDALVAFTKALAELEER